MAEAGFHYVTRQVEFASAHRLYREDWSETENRNVFAECANPHGHGHNYVLEATFRGRPDPRTGMVMHFREVKSVLAEVVVAPLDHQHLNHVPFLDGILPTSENIVAVLWDRIAAATSGRSWTLYKLRLSSTPRNAVEYFGP